MWRIVPFIVILIYYSRVTLATMPEMPSEIKGNFLLEMGWKVWPSHPLWGIALVLLFGYLILAMTNVIPDILSKYLRKRRGY